MMFKGVLYNTIVIPVYPRFWLRSFVRCPRETKLKFWKLNKSLRVNLDRKFRLKLFIVYCSPKCEKENLSTVSNLRLFYMCYVFDVIPLCFLKILVCDSRILFALEL